MTITTAKTAPAAGLLLVLPAAIGIPAADFTVVVAAPALLAAALAVPFLFEGLAACARRSNQTAASVQAASAEGQRG